MPADFASGLFSWLNRIVQAEPPFCTGQTVFAKLCPALQHLLGAQTGWRGAFLNEIDIVGYAQWFHQG
jgi:hypothetical protein